MAWYLEEGPVSDVVISTRVRLARNLANTPFPWRLKADELDYVKGKVIEAFRALCLTSGEKPLIVELEGLGAIESLALAERRIISRGMLVGKKGKALLLFPGEASGILVNEEDHLRLYAVSAGLRLDETADTVSQCAASLESRLPFAKNERLGYLTACPTNTGTGMRASVMLHVPGLIRSGVIRPLAEKLSKAGFVLRGAEGEGTDARADMIQLSNQVTLGVTAESILTDLGRLVIDLAREERKTRRMLYDRDPAALEDEVGRAMGLLTQARLMTSQEAMKLLSLVRLGRELGLEGMPDYGLIQSLMTETGEGAIQQGAGKPMDERERDQARAALIRQALLEKRA
ncbi:MAG TPA: ATP--guanido phosphotransferase [Bacillota bacterium]|jgi:protein arginine kinase|nr:ATP--guanido phosphotransferase [Fastidiosipila sp.]HPX93654.1 ATP--guanido phosphotransferase [Bacillota bacterium]HQB81553.1 ATP--guanido phosphotransferase [Bacillota bacterium]